MHQSRLKKFYLKHKIKFIVLLILLIPMGILAYNYRYKLKHYKNYLSYGLVFGLNSIPISNELTMANGSGYFIIITDKGERINTGDGIARLGYDKNNSNILIIESYTFHDVKDKLEVYNEYSEQLATLLDQQYWHQKFEHWHDIPEIKLNEQQKIQKKQLAALNKEKPFKEQISKLQKICDNLFDQTYTKEIKMYKLNIKTFEFTPIPTQDFTKYPYLEKASTFCSNLILPWR